MSTRTADKTGVLKLFGIKYQVGPGDGRSKLQIRFDPDALNEVEVWNKGKFVQRARPTSASNPFVR
ncbi:MAG: Mu transposase C-terminal domain-containing protein [Myxococcota bacterium]|nr:Mu transposase C-terminal domain-containing protein [Myxococcota bacterium]